MVDDASGRSRSRRRETRTTVLSAVLIGETVTVAGAAIGFRLHGYAFLSFLWLLPGIATLLWALARFERWHGRKLPLYLDRLVVVILFIPGVALGDWLQETLR